MLLEKCQGPECPRCGCQDSEEVDTRGRWGGLVLTRRVCRHCGYQWRKKKWGTGREELSGESPESIVESPEPTVEGNGEKVDGVPYYVTRCPKCNSRATKIVSSPKAVGDMPRIRRHKCKTCGNTFKSVERE